MWLEAHPILLMQLRKVIQTLSSNEYVPSQYGIRFAILRGYLLKYQKSHILCVSWKATLGNNGIVRTIRCLRILSNTPPTFLTYRMKIMTQSSSIVCLLSSYLAYHITSCAKRVRYSLYFVYKLIVNIGQRWYGAIHKGLINAVRWSP